MRNDLRRQARLLGATRAPLWGLLLLLSWTWTPSLGLAQTAEPDPFQQLARWSERYGRARRGLPESGLKLLCQSVADVRMLGLRQPERRVQALSALLDLAAAKSPGRALAELPSERSGQAVEVRKLALTASQSLLETDSGPRLATWLGTSVLSRREEEELERRVVACELLRGRHLPQTKLALFGAALDPLRDVREAATLALEGWQEDSVHRFLLDQLRRESEQPGWISPRIVRRHFTGIQMQPGTPATSALRGHLATALSGLDWRAAFRALQLAPALSDEDAVPLLLEALERWGQRRERNAGRLRLEGDLVAELRRRSGRNIGLHVERWKTWWSTRLKAREREDGPVPPEQLTHAEFFGLRPLTDRVVFVLDRSGSMDLDVSSGLRTRYQEAVEQMMSLLAGLGEETRFRVVLFSGDTLVWSGRLKPATKANLSSARTWARSRKPNGETNLRPGVEEAMRLDRRGRIDLERLEADTVIVVCDGATSEGPGWVRGMLEGANETACMTFHGVQIGSGGDGTLQRLAAGSGGQFVRVKP